MKMPTKISLLLTAALCLTAASAKPRMDQQVAPGYAEVAQVVNSKELSSVEKLTRLRELTGKEETRQIALYHLEQIDPAVAVDAALKIFRADTAARELKLRMGHFLLTSNRPQREGFPQAFVAEFAQYLTQAILDGGEAEFCRKLEGGLTTAVGEYACLASSFDGYTGIDFAPFKDARVVPVLVRCLNAPDNTYATNQGCLIRGKPGESTGRNTARQQIPVALAKLGDKQAVEPLKKVLFNHPDIYGKMNAAYALALLVDDSKNRVAIGKKLLAKTDLLRCRLPFGKGLIEAGDDAGVEFLAIKHAGGYGNTLQYPNQICYVLNQRLNVLHGFKSPKVEGFIRETLAFKPWRDLLLFKPGSARIDPASFVKPPKTDAEALQACAPQIVQTYGNLLKCVETNRLKSLAKELEIIAKESRNEEIRQMTRQCLQSVHSLPRSEEVIPNLFNSLGAGRTVIQSTNLPARPSEQVLVNWLRASDPKIHGLTKVGNYAVVLSKVSPTNQHSYVLRRFSAFNTGTGLDTNKVYLQIQIIPFGLACPEYHGVVDPNPPKLLSFWGEGG